MSRFENRNALILGIGSEIGQAMASRLRQQGWSVSGTYFRSGASHPTVERELRLQCDFFDKKSVDRAASELERSGLYFNLLLLSVGTLIPIGPFSELDSDTWEAGFTINFLGPARLTRRILPLMKNYDEYIPHCIFLVGGGINATTVAFSSYTLAKVSLVKLAEVIDAESTQVAVCSVGPGWVRTKIHSESLRDARTPSVIRVETERRYSENDFVDMSSVLSFLEWIITQPKAVVGGRNFSVSTDKLENMSMLMTQPEPSDLFKLRRRVN